VNRKEVRSLSVPLVVVSVPQVSRARSAPPDEPGTNSTASAPSTPASCVPRAASYLQVSPVRQFVHHRARLLLAGESAAACRPVAAAGALACDHSHQIRIRRPLFDLT
jgi:hypothetical protein